MILDTMVHTIPDDLAHPTIPEVNCTMKLDCIVFARKILKDDNREREKRVRGFGKAATKVPFF